MTATKATQLRSLLGTGRLLAGVGARDALDARLIEEAEFDFVWASSFCISAANCVPDSSILSMTQFLDAARAMNEAVRLPVVFDADTGYGDEHNVAYATKRIEEAGLAALCIEDKVFPKQTSSVREDGTLCCPLKSLPGRSSPPYPRARTKISLLSLERKRLSPALARRRHCGAHTPMKKPEPTASCSIPKVDQLPRLCSACAPGLEKRASSSRPQTIRTSPSR
jgi:hypothetical protein